MKLTEVGRLVHALMTLLAKKFILTLQKCHQLISGQIVGERGGTAFPFRFWRGNAVPLAYTTAVGGRGKRPSVVR